ncbi:MAG: hypothetical protein LBV72_07030 [Tannerella sp.]|jgi:chemotaxis protein CheY-P-specific phosphatase CheC|nr:hypothetical protein [Tannerella sp.]
MSTIKIHEIKNDLGVRFTTSVSTVRLRSKDGIRDLPDEVVFLIEGVTRKKVINGDLVLCVSRDEAKKLAGVLMKMVEERG